MSYGDGERGRDGVLGGERIACAEAHVRASGLQCECEVCGLRSHVQAGCKREPLQGFLLREALPDEADHGHLPRRPFNEADSLARQRRVFDVSEFSFRLQGALPS